MEKKSARKADDVTIRPPRRQKTNDDKETRGGTGGGLKRGSDGGGLKRGSDGSGLKRGSTNAARYEQRRDTCQSFAGRKAEKAPTG